MFKIISTLVTENENVSELAPIEIKTETQKKVEAASSPKPVVKSPPPSEKTATTTTVQAKQVTVPTSSEFYTIQVATFSDMRRTENLANQLKDKKFSPVYIKTRGKLFEVCVGKFSNPQEGQEILLKIRKDFHDAFIRKIQSPFEEK